MGQTIDKAIASAEKNPKEALLFIDRAVGSIITEPLSDEDMRRCAEFMLTPLRCISKDPIHFMYPGESESINISVLLACIRGITVICEDLERAKYFSSFSIENILLNIVEVNNSLFLKSPGICCALCELFAALAPLVGSSMKRNHICGFTNAVVKALSVCDAAQRSKVGDIPFGGCEPIRCICDSFCVMLAKFGEIGLASAVQAGALNLLLSISSQLTEKDDAVVASQASLIHAFSVMFSVNSVLDVGVQALIAIDGWAKIVVSVGMALASELQPSDDDGSGSERMSSAECKRREGVKYTCALIASVCHNSDACVEALMNENVLLFIVRAMRFMKKSPQYHASVTCALASILEAAVKPDSVLSETNLAKLTAIMLVSYGTVDYIGSCLQTHAGDIEITENCGRFISCLFKDPSAPNGILRSCLTIAPPSLNDILIRAFIPLVLAQLAHIDDQRECALTMCRTVFVPIAQYSYDVAKQLVNASVMKTLQRIMQDHPDDVDVIAVCLDALNSLIYNGENCKYVAETFQSQLVNLLRYHSSKTHIICAVMRIVQNISRLPSLSKSLSQAFLPLFTEVLLQHAEKESCILSKSASPAQISASVVSTEVVVTAVRAIAFLLSDPDVYAHSASETLLSFARGVLQRESDCRLEAEGGPRAKHKAPCAELSCCARALLRQVDSNIQTAESAGQCTHAYLHSSTCRSNGQCIAVDRGYCPNCAMSQRLRVCLQCPEASTHHYCLLCWEKSHHDHEYVEIFLPSSCDM